MTHQESLGKAQALYTQGDVDGAIALLRQETVASPGAPAVWSALGAMLLAKHDHDEAQRAYAQATALAPQDAEAHYGHGYALVGAGLFAPAIGVLDEALRLKPNHIPAKKLLVHALMQEGRRQGPVDPREAEDLAIRAHRLERTDPEPVAMLLELHGVLNAPQKAIHLLQDVPETMRQDPRVAALIQKWRQHPGFRLDAPKPQSPGANLAQDAQHRTVPCPGCGQPIMEWAAICPHCNHTIRVVARQGASRLDKPEWQEGAYNIVIVLYAAFFLLGTVVGVMTSEGGERTGIVMGGIVNSAFAVGLYQRWEPLFLVARIFLWLQLLVFTVWTIGSIMSGTVLGVVMFITAMAVSGFVLYLVNYVGD